LLFVLGFREFQQQDLRGEVVDVGESKCCQALLQLVSNDLDLD
jgi:hypothetical protein